MLIDWFTVVAQIVNFLVLVWLLKRFLYKPILNAINGREQFIARQLEDAGGKKAEAQKDRDDLQAEKEGMDVQRREALGRVASEASAQRQRLLDDTRREAEQLRSQLQEKMRSDQSSLSREITVRTQTEVFAIVRKTIADLATANLEEAICEAFVRRLRQLDAREKELISTALQSSSRPATVRTAFALTHEVQATIERAINDVFALASQIRFETAPALVGGIELTTDGHQVSWNITDYLTSLEKSLGELLENKSSSESETREIVTQHAI
ncbi:MAG: F0F1 ATP synthase subunit delta [Dehalococcoidia bacterium]|nr:F0F1 ATP synthase subunit delta [Dehalococcoidia bacterium]